VLSLSELGKKLKEEREKKQLSLEDIQQETKIQKRYLKAIEEGRFETLPGKFYARAFVKNYAEVVGLDPEQLFDELGSELPSPTKDATDLPKRTERSNQTVHSEEKRKNSFLTALTSFVIILIIIIGIYIFVQKMANDDLAGITPNEQDEQFEADFSEEFPIVEEPEDILEPDPEPEVEDPIIEQPTQEIELVDTKGNTSFYELSGTEEFSAIITYTGVTYVGIKNTKGKSFFADNAQDGDLHEHDFSAESAIEFNFGASQNAELKINGELIEFPLKDNQGRNMVHQKVNITLMGTQ
jgi:cytoskeletal protein RodZ